VRPSRRDAPRACHADRRGVTLDPPNAAKPQSDADHEQDSKSHSQYIEHADADRVANRRTHFHGSHDSVGHAERHPNPDASEHRDADG
jgi:hypothetical protein